jgi:hypothetical protein
MKVPKFSHLKFPQLWGPITLRANLWLKWSLKQNYNSHQELSNSMLHIAWMQGNQSDSWFLLLGSQIANLIPDPSFGYNLCVKCPNGSCEPILYIYVSRAFQLCKKLVNLMGFDLCNCSLKIRESTKTPTPKVGVHLGVWGFIPSHSLALPWAWNVTPGLHIRLTPSQAFALVVSPKLVMTI